MKKNLSFVITILLLFVLFVGCAPSSGVQDPEGGSKKDVSDADIVEQQVAAFLPEITVAEENRVLPPSRIGTEGTLSAIWHWESLEAAYAQADLVAVVQIQNWLGEKDTGFPGTYFDAVVVKDYKAKATGPIVLLQDGASSHTHKGYPLFSYGNAIFVFLKKTDAAPYENAYYILNPAMNLADVVEPSPGEVYFVERGEVFQKEYKSLENYGTDKNLSKAVLNSLRLNDSLRYPSDLEHPIGQFYKESDVEELLKSLAKKQGGTSK